MPKVVLSKRRWVIAGFFIIPFIAFLCIDALFPMPIPGNEKHFAVVVLSQDSTPLWTFPDENGVWRYPIKLSDVSPLYLEALITYEDRWFRYHLGVNPLSLLRALGQYIRYRKPTSGGSTLTMQVARILDPHERSLAGKLKQMFRAFQLEWHYTKDEILTLYLNYVPFGGPIEGVQAASFAYLDKPASELSHAEAALLAVLPQSPTRLRPDRHPARAARARNKVLDRMVRYRVWDRETVKDAKIERVLSRFDPRPMLAPLLARRLNKGGQGGHIIRTTIDPFLQQMAEELVHGYIEGSPDHTSAAALIVENETLAVKAYVGSADFLDNNRFGHVDMVTAYRSPGSTLKPFLYGFAIEEGLIHSESLMVDAPFSFSGYRPGNFAEGFSGPVSAGEALQRSLNLPAVDLLDRLGPHFFDARLRQGGLHLKFPEHESPNLTMILGGVGATLEELVGAYTGFARDGVSAKVRYKPDDPLIENRMINSGAAYIIRQILQEYRRPDLPAGSLSLDSSRQVAWKTGTSYGFRDAWTIGVTDRYTIGIWVGRPDGTPCPGQYGRATAAPLLFSMVDGLPRQHGSPSQHENGSAGSQGRSTGGCPSSVSLREICWPLGTCASGETDPLCHQRRKAWVLNDVIPPTFPDRSDRFWQSNPINILINPATGLRVDADCPVQNPTVQTIARWPKAAEPWLNPELRAASRIPRLDPICRKPVSSNPDNIQIVGIEPDSIFRPPGAQIELPTITLQAQGGRDQLFWMLNGKLIAQSNIGQIRYYKFEHPGRYQLTVMDLAGNYDSLEIMVIGAGSETFTQ